MCLSLKYKSILFSLILCLYHANQVKINKIILCPKPCTLSVSHCRCTLQECILEGYMNCMFVVPKFSKLSRMEGGWDKVLEDESEVPVTKESQYKFRLYFEL